MTYSASFIKVGFVRQVRVGVTVNHCTIEAAILDIDLNKHPDLDITKYFTIWHNGQNSVLWSNDDQILSD
jgi:hypothetical protein